MKIKTLNQEVINQIAAGEVIVEPASIVKELTENSIDAGSTRIDIKIKDGGKKEIVISDNGTGISYDDIPLAFRRHATSKINFLKDLDSLETMGFRGEALSSIAAVADVDIITRADEEELGSTALFRDGKLKEQMLCSYEKGTTITVSDLFQNIPARYKFLKSSKKEEAIIRDIVEKLALAHPDISISYTNNDQKVFKTPGNGSLKDTAYIIFGPNFAKHLYTFKTENLPMKIYGLIGDLDARRTYRDNQIFYINGRYIKSPILSKAYEEEWAGKLMKHQYPSGIIFIDLPPYMIDVNVHPQKTEVNILNKTLITLLFRQCIRQVLEDLDLIPKFLENEVKEQANLPRLEINEEETFKPVQEQMNLNSAAPSSKIEPESKSNVFKNESIREDIKPHQNFKEIEINTGEKDLKETSKIVNKEEKDLKETSKIVNKEEKGLDLTSFKFIGVLFNTYILLENEKVFYLIDQHAAHEATLYEEYSKIINSNDTFVSQIIIDHDVEVSNKELESYLNIKEELEKFGFKAEVKDDLITVKAVPLILGITQPPELIIPMINYLDQVSDNKPDYGLEKVISMSCKAAVKAGNILDPREIENLLDRLSRLKNPYTCPHGRPVIIKRSQYEIEKLFKRVV